MTAPGCGDPAHCPVPDPDDIDLRHVTSAVLPTATPLRRGHKLRHAPDEPVPARAALPPPHDMSRFAPILGQPHAYVARRELAALLESVLHDVIPGAARVRWPLLGAWALSHVRLRREVRLVDLRDDALANLGLQRHELVATDPAHYPCTRVWAARLHHRRVGGHPTFGLLWNSRQAELHAEHPVPVLLADVLVGEQSEVAVLWPERHGRLLDLDAGPWPLDDGRGLDLLRELATLLGAPPPLLGPA